MRDFSRVNFALLGFWEEGLELERKEHDRNLSEILQLPKSLGEHAVWAYYWTQNSLNWGGGDGKRKQKKKRSIQEGKGGERKYTKTTQGTAGWGVYG